MFSKLVRLAVFVLACSVLATAQDAGVEYGQPTELSGVTKVFVDTGVDMQQRNLIVNDLQKLLPNLTVVSRPEESDIHLRFSLKQTPGKTDWVGAVVKIVENNRVRVLFGWTDATPPIFERDTFMSWAMDSAKPHMFVRQFARIYKKVNSVSKT